MLKLNEAFLMFLIASILAITIGLAIRLFREKINIRLWPLGYLMYFLHVIGDITIPFIISYRTLFKKNEASKKMTTTKRLISGIVCIPIAYTILLGSFPSVSEEFIWTPLRTSNKRLDMMKRKKEKLRVYKDIEIPPKYHENFSASMKSSVRHLEHSLSF